MKVTLDASHDDISALNENASRNMLCQLKRMKQVTKEANLAKIRVIIHIFKMLYSIFRVSIHLNRKYP
mgnify:CR=1 FL=1